MASAQQQPKGKSPYAKYNKQPQRYSSEYYAWKNLAVKLGGDHRLTLEAHSDWKRKFFNEREYKNRIDRFKRREEEKRARHIK